MYYHESDIIASEYPHLSEEIERVDKFLFERNGNAFYAGTASDKLRIKLPDLEGILNIYSSKKVLNEFKVWLCPIDGQEIDFISDEMLHCDLCGQNYSEEACNRKQLYLARPAFPAISTAKFEEPNQLQDIGNKTMLPPDMYASAFTLLFEVGRWAMSELHERWTLSRDQHRADLTDTKSAEAPLQSIVQKAMTGDSAQVIELINRTINLINLERSAKIADREQSGRGEITQAMFEQREMSHDKNIKKYLNEIANDLKSIGIEVERKLNL